MTDTMTAQYVGFYISLNACVAIDKNAQKSDAMSVARNTVICRRNEKGKA